MTAINPLVDFALSADGRFTFKNAAIDAGVGKPPAGGYRAVFATFNNDTDTASAIGTPASGTGLDLTAPSGLPASPGAFAKISVAAVDAAEPSWNQPVDVYFRRTASGWQLVGVDRLPTSK
jgi:hypothetical protein